MTQLASRIPKPPAIEPCDRVSAPRIAGRALLACGWCLGAAIAVALVLSGAVVAAVVAVGMISARGLAGARGRVTARRRALARRRRELSTALNPDLG